MVAVSRCVSGINCALISPVAMSSCSASATCLAISIRSSELMWGVVAEVSLMVWLAADMQIIPYCRWGIFDEVCSIVLSPILWGLG